MQMGKVFFSEGGASAPSIATGWYFQIDLAEPKGPFDTRTEAMAAAQEHAEDVPKQATTFAPRPIANDRELAAVLAGLRLLQESVHIEGHNSLPPMIDDIFQDGGTIDALNPVEIDELCERLNLGEAIEHLILKYLDCSTAHLPADFRELLWNEMGPFTEIGTDQYRQWVYIDEETLSAERLEDCPMPEAVRNIVRFALDNGCSVICFDPDGTELPTAFPLFDDEEIQE